MREMNGVPSIKDQIAKLQGHIFGNWQTCVIYVFARLEIADLLHEKKMTIHELADRCGMKEDMMRVFLNGAWTLGLIDKFDDCCALKPMGDLLRTDHPMSQRSLALLNGSPYRYDPWGRLLDILKAGSSRGISPQHDIGSLEYLKDKQKDHQIFNQAMTSHSVWQNNCLADAYDFSSFNHLVDVGCGEGSFVKTVLRSNPRLTGSMFDLPQTLELGGEIPSDLSDRLEWAPGDFFKKVTCRGDIYVMKNVIHNWPEPKVKRILRNVRAAMDASQETGRQSMRRLLIIEYLVTDDPDSIVHWLNLSFLVINDGKERSLEEYATLAQETGFRLLQAIPTQIGRHILELEPI